MNLKRLIATMLSVATLTSCQVPLPVTVTQTPSTDSKQLTASGKKPGARLHRVSSDKKYKVLSMPEPEEEEGFWYGTVVREPFPDWYFGPEWAADYNNSPDGYVFRLTVPVPPENGGGYSHYWCFHRNHEGYPIGNGFLGHYQFIIATFSYTPYPSPIDTPSPSPTPTPIDTPTPSPTPTDTPTPTPSELPTESPTPPPPTPVPPTPTPSDDPGPLSIEAEEFFSPNGDGRKDNNTIDVHCRGAWKVTVDGSIINKGEGSGFDIFSWDGHLKGKKKPLPDGKYTLVLTRLSDGKTESVDVILDTVKPDVSEVSVASVEDNGTEGNYIYTLNYQAKDATVGVPSEIEESGGDIKDANASASKQEDSKSLGSDNYELKIKVEPAQLDTFKFKVTVLDRAGNLGQGAGKLSAKLNDAGLGFKDSEDCSPDNLNHYSTLGIPKGPAEIPLLLAQEGLKLCFTPVSLDVENKPFFYVNGRTTYKYGYGFQVGIPGTEVKVTQFKVALRGTITVVNRNTGDVWAQYDVASETLKDNFGKFFFTWNGHMNNNSGDSLLAPQAQYKVQMKVQPKYPPGWTIDVPKNEAKTNLQDIRVINNISGQKWGPDSPGTNGQITYWFQVYKDNIGSAGTGTGRKSHQWHHIVEKNQDWLSVSQLNSTRNLVRIDSKTHDLVTGYFNGPDEELTGDKKKKVRTWLYEQKKDFDYQHRLGLSILAENGWTYEKQGD